MPDDPPTSPPVKLNTQQVGRTGEHFVAAELHRRGAYAVTFSGNMPDIDILASADRRGARKGAGVLLLLTLAPRLIRSPFDGLVVGALVGLGFQISEDISYAFIGAANAFGDVGAAWETIIGRTLVSIPSHWIFSGISAPG